MPRDGIEVRVVVKHCGATPDGRDRDEAVNEAPDGLPSRTAGPIDEGGLLVIGKPLNMKERKASESRMQHLKLSGRSSSGEQFHRDRFRDDEVSVREQKPSHRSVWRTTGRAEELDPGRGVDEDQISG